MKVKQSCLKSFVKSSGCICLCFKLKKIVASWVADSQHNEPNQSQSKYWVEFCAHLPGSEYIA